MFISHSSKNKSLAAAVTAALEANGIPCWISTRDIRPGAPNYGLAILEGLAACQAVVLLLTEASNRSQHVMKEAERAVSKRIPILVVKFQPINVSKELEYYISSAQFLDATEPPPQQHFPTIRNSIRELLDSPRRSTSDDDVSRTRAPRQPHRRRRPWAVLLAVPAIIAVVGVSGWMLVVPAIQSLLASVTPAPNMAPATPPDPALAERTAFELDIDEHTTEAQHTLLVPPTLSPASTHAFGKGDDSLIAEIEEKARLSGRLASFAKLRLANFHREALLITPVSGLASGNVTDNDAEIIGSCRLQPNMSGYASMARELIGLLEMSAHKKGAFTSDGLRTSEGYGRDARPYLKELCRGALWWSTGLPSIFASDSQRNIVCEQARGGQSPLISFKSIFLIHSEELTARDRSGVGALWAENGQLLNQDHSGIVVLLDSIQNSFRHTTWRWYYLTNTDWMNVSATAPRAFRCMLTLSDASGITVERDYYPIRNYGVMDVRHSRGGGVHYSRGILLFAPFFMNVDMEYYIPEITLTKSVVVLRADVPRVKDFTATIEEVPNRVP